MIILATGATGFVGSALCAEFMRRGHSVRATMRSPGAMAEVKDTVVVGSIDGETDWSKALQNVAVVVHLAARAHVMDDFSANPAAEYLKINLLGTENLARQAALAGVKRFVYISSIKVNGEQTKPTVPFTELDPPGPQGHYAISKWKAEQALLHIAGETQMEIVIIRPPLVYGLGVKANFAALRSAVIRGSLLPLGAANNRRSMVALDNLVDFIIASSTHPKAANETFLVSDGQDLSTAELVLGLAQASGMPARVFPVPVWVLRTGAALLGKRDVIDRLCSNLQVDITKARNLIGWTPPISVVEGLRRAVQGPKAP